ncbi:MAG: M28 family peptidase [Planctomycetota bacterium]
MLATSFVLGLLALAPQPPASPVPPQDSARYDASSDGLERTVRDLVGFGTRHVLSATDDADRGTGAARDYLESRYRGLIELSGGRLQVTREAYEVSVRRRGMPGSVSVTNIVATLPGTSDPERVYVVGGHYDSRNSSGADGEGDSPGANDDGSGTAVALEVCRLLCQQEFAATIVFVAYDGEEQGLLGSAAHARALAAQDVVVDGMITNDIVGNTRGMDGVIRNDYLRCFSYAPVGNDSIGRSMARELARAARSVEGLRIKLVFRGDRYGRGGDHRPFFQEGFPSVRLSEPREDFSRQHQDLTERDGRPYGDLPDFVDFSYLARVANVNAHCLAELARAPRPVSAIRIVGAREAYDTMVSFGLVGGAAGYEIVWRDTTSPDWEGSRVVSPDEVQVDERGVWATVRLEGVCIDDVVVGVRSISEDGARSRATAAPEPDNFSARRGR